MSNSPITTPENSPFILWRGNTHQMCLLDLPMPDLIKINDQFIKRHSNFGELTSSKASLMDKIRTRTKKTVSSRRATMKDVIEDLSLMLDRYEEVVDESGIKDDGYELTHIEPVVDLGPTDIDQATITKGSLFVSRLTDGTDTTHLLRGFTLIEFARPAYRKATPIDWGGFAVAFVFNKPG